MNDGWSKAVCWIFRYGPQPVRRLVIRWVADQEPELVDVILPSMIRNGGRKARLAALQLAVAVRRAGNVRWVVLALRDREPTVRAAAAHVLGVYRSVATGQYLAQALSDPHPDVRLTAAHALGRIPVITFSRALEQRLADPDERVREVAIISLGRVGRSEAQRALRKVAGGAFRPSVRRIAQESMEQIQRRMAPSEEKRHRARVDLVEVMLDGAHPWSKREQAKRCLMRIGGLGLVPLLEEGLLKTNDTTVHLQIVEVLASLPPGEQAQKALLGHLHHISAPVRRLAIESLGKTGDQEAIYYLGQIAREGQRREGLLNRTDARLASEAIEKIKRRQRHFM